MRMVPDIHKDMLASSFGMFRKSLDYALQMGYVEKNISKQSNAIPKGKVMSHIGQRANLKLLFPKFTLKMYMNI